MLCPSRLMLVILGLTPLALAQDDGITTVRIASGISIPTSLSSPPGDTQRLFVTSARTGVRLIKDGTLLSTPFLDMTAILPEAHELVEHGRIDEADFRDFVFSNAVRFYTDTNPNFFEGTVIDSAVA